ncbi:MAG: glycosyltransferase family 2 protein [Fibrobacteria bacterium]
MPQISIVIVTWNSQQVLRDCVSSLFALVPEETFELLLVDNASKDGDYLDAYSMRSNVRVIRNQDNLGYAKAVNIGLRAATGEYHLILNPDMVFLSNPFPKLIAGLQTNPEIGAIAPLLYGSDGKPQIQDFYPKFPTLLQFILLRSLLGKLTLSKRLAVRFCHSHVALSGTHFVDQIPGAFLLFHKNRFLGKDALNEAYFIWMEDVDFCLTLKGMGLKAAVDADERITHIGGTSFKMWDVSRKKLMFTESFMTYLRLHHGVASHLAHGLLMSLNAIAIALIMTAVYAPKLSLVDIRSRFILEGKVLALIAKSLIARLATFWR